MAPRVLPDTAHAARRFISVWLPKTIWHFRVVFQTIGDRRMSMKILFVYPEFPDTFWSFKHALKFIRKKAGAPPLGLLTVAAMLPVEWEKKLIDLNVMELTEKDLKWADYVFL